ncbi:MAG: GIY-YIG nuclease family protein [Ginsengibacter sp.]
MKTKKELKKEYGSMKFKIGVFQIKNIANNKIYIDRSVNLNKIWNRHQLELNYGMHRNLALQAEWNEFGESNFVFEILSEIKQADEQNTDYTKESKLLAKMFMKELQLFGKKGYN